MYNFIEEKLIKDIGLQRYNHSLRVTELALELAEIHNGDINKTKMAAILHDCGKIQEDMDLLKRVSNLGIILDKNMKHNLQLIHGPLGAKIAENEYGIQDKEILDAIYYHTIGRENMTVLDKIIYIADYIEPNRNFKGIEEIRKMAYTDLDKSIRIAMENTIVFLIDNGKLIHTETIKSRNNLIIEENLKNKTIL